MKKKILKIAAYSAFVFLMFFLSLFLTFPFDSLTPMISRIAEKETGVKLDIKSVTPTFLFGMTLRDISVLGKEKELIYSFDTASVSLPALSLLLLSPEIEYSLTKNQGTLKGKVRQTDEKGIAFSFNIKTPSIKTLFNNRDFVGPEGALNADVDLHVPLIKIMTGEWENDLIKSGKLSFSIQQGKIIIPALPVQVLSDIPFKTITGKVSISNEILKVDKLEIDGDIRGSIKGSIMIGNPLPESRLNLKLRFKLSKPLLDKVAPLIAVLNHKKERDGYYSFDLKGTFLHPKPII